MSQWDCSLALVNNELPIKSAFSSVIVCDGDVEFLGLKVDKCLIIANGSIRPAAKADWPSITHSILYAAGDVVFPGPGPFRTSDTWFSAGGAIKTAGKVERGDRIKERVAEAPFGVRFLDPGRDFGLELEPRDGGLRVTRVADWSRFAKYDVREGDVITRINEVAADTAPAFRRELRRGVVQEWAAVHIRRGGEKMARIVFLDGLPTDPARIAPPPREAIRP